MFTQVPARSWMIVAYALCLIGCSDGGTTATPAKGTGSPADAPGHRASSAVIPTPADRSLTSADYIKAGLPAYDRRWNGEDMARAANVLAAVVRKDATHLPRYRSGNSGTAFHRLTAGDNLDFYRDRSLPLAQRFPDALAYMEATNQVAKLYLTACMQRTASGGELVELLGAQLRMTVVMLDLVNEFVPTLDQNDPSYSVRMNGIATMRSGAATMVAGNLQSLTESSNFRAEELKRLIGYLQATLPKILPELSSASRSEIQVRLRSYAKDPQLQHLQPELDQLVTAVEKVAPSTVN